MKIQINVTKEILERSAGCKGYLVSESCAFALALRELFPNASVGADTMSFDKHMDNMYCVDLPLKMKQFIYEFDSSGYLERLHMRPQSFEIEVPDCVINRIGIGTVYKVLSESKTLQHVNQ